MPASAPPAYAWDWFARQRLLWREARTRIAQSDSPAARRYARLETRNDTLPALRADYPDDAHVHDIVDDVVTEFVFLGRIDRSFVHLGVTNAPRGMRWWWSALTGESLDAPDTTRRAAGAAMLAGQLTLDEVLEGYGDTTY
ncbi:MAG: hypothetical protein WD377_06440 [Nitriliruptoraceae bacterium]